MQAWWEEQEAKRTSQLRAWSRKKELEAGGAMKSQCLSQAASFSSKATPPNPSQTSPLIGKQIFKFTNQWDVFTQTTSTAMHTSPF